MLLKSDSLALKGVVEPLLLSHEGGVLGRQCDFSPVSASANEFLLVYNPLQNIIVPTVGRVTHIARTAKALIGRCTNVVKDKFHHNRASGVRFNPKRNHAHAIL